ncbi:MAG: FixH family protein [Burkholderiales bacterium]
MRLARSSVAGCALAAAGAALACGEDLAGPRTTVEGGRYVIAYTTSPSPVVVGQHFTVDFAVCAASGAAAPQSVRVDANMPEHRHGMNYRVTVTSPRPGVYRGDGLLFHMPGRWDLTFDVVAGGATRRLTSTMKVE